MQHPPLPRRTTRSASTCASTFCTLTGGRMAQSAGYVLGPEVIAIAAEAFGRSWHFIEQDPVLAGQERQALKAELARAICVRRAAVNATICAWPIARSASCARNWNGRQKVIVPRRCAGFARLAARRNVVARMSAKREIRGRLSPHFAVAHARDERTINSPAWRRARADNPRWCAGRARRARRRGRSPPR